MSDYDKDLLEQGILHYKFKEFDAARRYCERALEVADDYETRTRAYYYLSLMTTDLKEKRNYLEEVLAIDPVHAEARRDLAILDGRLKPEEIVNPDALARQTTGTVAAQSDRFTCPKCGGKMTFAADGHSLVCEYCNRAQILGDKRTREQDFFAAMATSKGHSVPVAMQISHCQGCGAEFILPAQEMATICAYCGSAHVTRQQRDLSTPDSVIPMTVDHHTVENALLARMGKYSIILKDNGLSPRGFYIPVWTFDLVGSIPWNGFVYRDKKRIPVSGDEPVNSHGAHVPASKKLSDLLPDLLPGFNFYSAVEYDPRFLAGWPVQVYEVPLATAALSARASVVKEIRAKIVSNHGQVMDLNYVTSGVSISAFNLVLVPLWLAEVSVEGQVLRVAINGASGEVYGKTPRRGIAGWIEDMVNGK
jgi:predicted RNA-binding Zn-ribbon protein involved in translation (DUF1610 family)